MLELYTQPPAGLIMPATAQLWTTLIYGVGALLFIFLAIRLALRERSVLPLLMILGAALTVYLEPIVDVLGNAVHPQMGQLNLLTTNGHPVPWAVLIGYLWYFAACPLLCYSMLKQRALSQRFVWWTFASVVAGASVVEQIPLHFGVWVYYGEQLPKIGYMPIWWIFANAAAVLVPFILVYKLFPMLSGRRQWLLVPLMPSGAFMGHAAAGWPMYNLLGTDTAALPAVALYLGTLSTVALSVLMVWLLMVVTDIPPRHVLASSAIQNRQFGAVRDR
ncbi:hypothetical protein [Pseudomonas sp. TCU-HL1]|uniref:hypothetical protein n=1 Tax=Pseudomonas sp. TCU-HL1 TaxID=1856685 RepID=UPI00083CA6E6|nr:hypothetical protein [Pseudomonas sp. TCU-HL1]AOE86777.1 hypothetical protein THL1_4229 [Pseudomonas sp. TCU-HL1]